MAGYRQFHTKFWKDEWLIEMEPLERYLFSYLFTNELSSISGIFKLPLRIIINETGLEREFVEKTLGKFQDAHKIMYQDGIMWVVKMAQYHKNASPRTMVRVNADIAEIPDCPVKTSYLYYQKTGIYSMDTVSIPDSVILRLSLNKDKDKDEDEAETETPTTPTPSYSLPPKMVEEKIFCSVTNYPTIPNGELDAVINAIASISTSKGLDANQTIDYLRPFFREAKKRYPMTTKAFWLTDWAVAGTIPEPNGNKKPVDIWEGLR